MKRKIWDGSYVEKSIEAVIAEETKSIDSLGSLEELQFSNDRLIRIVQFLAERLPAEQQADLANHLLGFKVYE